MAYPLSALAQQTLRSSHSITVRATGISPTQGTQVGLPVVGGEVVYDAGSSVRRTARVELADPTLWPAAATDLLSPSGAEMYLEYGIVLGGGQIEWVPLIWGVVTGVSRQRPATSGTGPVVVTLGDRSTKVQDDRFTVPSQTISGATTVSEITRLIQQTLPSVTVTDTTGSTQVAAVLDMERERWADGVEKLADSIGAECFADRIGGFTVRVQPQITDPVAWDIRAGSGGVLVSKQDEVTRDRVYNQVVAKGQRADGTAPAYAAVADNDPTSPTYYGGTFGRKTRFYSNPLLTTNTMAATAAAALLARVKGMQAQITLTIVPSPGIDPGDVIVVRDGTGAVQQHIVDRVTIPLSLTAAQTLSSRSLDLPPEG